MRSLVETDGGAQWSCQRRVGRRRIFKCYLTAVQAGLYLGLQLWSSIDLLPKAGAKSGPQPGGGVHYCTYVVMRSPQLRGAKTCAADALWAGRWYGCRASADANGNEPDGAALLPPSADGVMK